MTGDSIEPGDPDEGSAGEPVNLPSRGVTTGPTLGLSTSQSTAAARPTRRRRRWAAGGLAALLVVSGLTAVAIGADESGAGTSTGDAVAAATSDPSSPPTSSEAGGMVPPDPLAPGVPMADLTALLDARSEAAVDGLVPEFLSTVSTRSIAELDKQRVLAANLKEIGFSRWSYTLGAEADPSSEVAQRLRSLSGDDALIFDAALGYRIRGYDAETVEADHVIAFAKDNGTWKVVADVDNGTFRSPWVDTPLTATRGERTLVLSAGARSVPTGQLARIADDAVGQVSAVWGDAWDERAVIIVPRTQSELGRFLRRDGDQYGSLAAVATSELSTDDSGASANRVWVNPGTWGRVNAVGRAIVLRHEITHVATGAAVPSDFPVWLEEGLADYIGYLGSGVRPATVARDLLASVRADGPPKRLPTRADFAPRSGQLSVAYEGSWWACRLIAERYGQDALLAVYRAALEAGGADAADQGLQSVLGITEAELTREWQQSLQRAA